MAWGNTCWTVARQVVAEARRLKLVDQQLVDDVIALPRLRGSSGRLGRDVDGGEVAALLGACNPESSALIVTIDEHEVHKSEACLSRPFLRLPPRWSRSGSPVPSTKYQVPSTKYKLH